MAPRHVRHYLRELREHLDDARRAEFARGVEPAGAEQAAWQRLGSAESLVQSVLARPELRSTGARFPALVFGLGPVLAWLAVITATVVLLHLLAESVAEQKKPASWIVIAVASHGSHHLIQPSCVGMRSDGASSSAPTMTPTLLGCR